MTTENHELNTPEEGTLNWDEPINENFRWLDTEIEIRDTEANIDQYTPKEDAKFLATDTGRRYLGTGTNWTEAPIHLPDTLTAPTYSQENTSDTANGEIWYRSDTGSLIVQMQAGTVDLVTGEVISESTSTDSGDDSEDGESTNQDGTGISGEDASFVVMSTTEGAEFDYTFTVDGSVSRDASGVRAEDTDTIVENDDGTVTVTGFAGNTYGDGFKVDGELLSFEKTGGESEFQLIFNGEDVTSELTA